MSEFCAGVKILLERMKSNPEDFELIDYDMSTIQGVQGRFYNFANAMEQVILGDDKGNPWKDWQYFTEEERKALIAGFKEMKRTKFDKAVMERVFDEQYIERQQEAIRLSKQPQYYQPSKNSPPQIQPIHAAQQMQGGYMTTTDNTGGGLMGAIGLGGIF
jgi:hypothetical protein